MHGDNLHHTGTQHRTPAKNSAGWQRVVLRVCGGHRDYFGEYNCAHGYTWTCEECPWLLDKWARDEI